MMGVQQEPQGSLFYVGINLDKRIRKEHPLRRIGEIIDFNWTRMRLNVGLAGFVISTLVLGCAGRAANPAMIQQYGDERKTCRRSNAKWHE